MVALFVPKAQWMCFPSLDRTTSDVKAVYTLAWRFTDVPSDAWTTRVNNFKANIQAAIIGAAFTLREALPALIREMKWDENEAAITAALSSGDTKINLMKPMPMVASKLAGRFGLKWLPNLLTKQAHKPLHNMSNGADRTAEIEKASYQATVLPGGTKRVLVFDDLATRGQTLSAIAAAIKKNSPKVEVVGVALGKTERRGYAASSGQDLSNDHVPVAWATIWDTKR